MIEVKPLLLVVWAAGWLAVGGLLVSWLLTEWRDEQDEKRRLWLRRQEARRAREAAEAGRQGRWE